MTRAGEDMEKLEYLLTAGKMVQSLLEAVSQFLKELDIEKSYDPAIPLLKLKRIESRDTTDI